MKEKTEGYTVQLDAKTADALRMVAASKHKGNASAVLRHGLFLYFDRLRASFPTPLPTTSKEAPGQTAIEVPKKKTAKNNKPKNKKA